MYNITCCYHCPAKWVSEEYNCHSHCEAYADECWDNELERRRKRTAQELSSEYQEAVRKAARAKRSGGSMKG